MAETEDDVMSLAVSFLLVQAPEISAQISCKALRFAISGHLPNVEALRKDAFRPRFGLQGNDPEGLRQPNVCSELLLFSGFLFGGFDLMRISLRRALESSCLGSREARHGRSSDKRGTKRRSRTTPSTSWMRLQDIDKKRYVM